MIRVQKLLGGSRHGKVVLLVIVAALAAVVYVGLSTLSGARSPLGSPAGTPAVDPEAGFDVAVPSARRVAGFVETYGPKIEENERVLGKLQEDLRASQARQKEQEDLLRVLIEDMKAQARAKSETGRAKDRPAEAPDRMAFPNIPSPVPTPVALHGAQGEAPLPVSRIHRIKLAGTPSSGPKDVHVPAGSFAEGILLTGVFAPVEGQAMPVKIRLTSEFIAPNRARVPLGDAFLIGKAVGDANSERAIVQLERLSYVHTDGRSIEVSLNGYIADADGIQGASGKYVWRVADLVTYSAVAGGISGVAEAGAASQTTTQLNPLGGATQVVTGDIAKFAGFRGASRASEELNKILLKRIEQVEPAIWVPNGKKITVTLIEGVTLPGLPPKEIDYGDRGDRRSPFSGLDLDR